MNRQIWTTIPRADRRSLIPPRPPELMKKYFNKSAHVLQELRSGTRVLLDDLNRHGTVL